MNRANPQARGSLVALALFLVAAPASAATILINNGLMPPAATNVIDSSNSYPTDHVVVTNVGCDDVSACDPAGAATTVSLVDGGIVGISLFVEGSSVLQMSGGAIPRDSGVPNSGSQVLGGNGTATVSISGGAVGALVMFGASTVTFTGGTIDFAEITGSMAIHGGNLSILQVYFGGITTVYGTNFAVDGVPVGYGAVAPDFGVLTGTLQSGESINLEFNRRAYGESPGSGFLILVPEPGMAILFASGLIGLAALGRRPASTS